MLWAVVFIFLSLYLLTSALVIMRLQLRPTDYKQLIISGSLLQTLKSQS